MHMQLIHGADHVYGIYCTHLVETFRKDNQAAWWNYQSDEGLSQCACEVSQMHAKWQAQTVVRELFH